MSARVTVDEACDAAAIARLRDEWGDLCDRAACTPFQRPEWLLPWLRHFAPERPWAIALRRDGRLAGLAPLFVWERGGERVVALLGAGISDSLDAVLEPGFEEDGARALFDHLAATRSRWDACELDALQAGATLGRCALPRGWSDAREPQDPCPRVALPTSLDALSDHVPSHQLARLRKYRRRAERAGAFATACARRDGWEEALDALLALHAARWRSRGEEGVLAGAELPAFHRDVAAGFARRGALRLHTLSFDGARIASLYAFAEKDVVYCYLQGFDPRFEKMSPGVMIVGAAIEDAVRDGARAIDFLRGREPYKYAWGAVDVPACKRRIVPAIADDRVAAARPAAPRVDA